MADEAGVRSPESETPTSNAPAKLPIEDTLGLSEPEVEDNVDQVAQGSAQSRVNEAGISSSKRQRSPSEEGEELDENPPLPDAESSLPNGEPPLPDEEPPLPEEEPPLPDEEPPLPDEEPPLPDEKPPLRDEPPDDGWEARQDLTSGAWYFFNRFTGVSQWENPRVPEGTDNGLSSAESSKSAKLLSEYKGYNPKIHGDFDPNADYAKFHASESTADEVEETAAAEHLIGTYEQSATFNRFTGKFQSKDKTTEHHNDENKARRQMQAFFDPDAAANSHGGRSLKAERSKRKLSKKEIGEFNSKKKQRKQDKQMAFLKS